MLDGRNIRELIVRRADETPEREMGVDETGRRLTFGEKLFPHVRTFPGGGAPKPPSLHYELKAAFGVGVVSGYRLTEAPILTMNHHDASDEVLATTEGHAVAGTTLRIVTVDGKDAGVGEEGEVRAKGPHLTLGYLDPALDGDAFDDEGWFRTRRPRPPRRRRQRDDHWPAQGRHHP